MTPGTKVCSQLPIIHPFQTVHKNSPQTSVQNPTNANLHYSQCKLTALPNQPFSIAVPENGAALDEHWKRIAKQTIMSQILQPTGYLDSLGIEKLRIEIAQYVRKARAVNCSPHQILITERTQQGLYLSTKVLLNEGDSVIVENPIYPGLMSILKDRKLNILPIDVDSQGINVSDILKNEWCNDAKVIFLTPSHQYPLGMPLSMPRRQALIEWAQNNNKWIVEDDYDSELRYTGLPFPSLQGLDQNRVIYLGTFSKVLAPSLRVGYVILPETLVEAFAGARSIIGRNSSSLEQHMIAKYMAEGYFENHIRRIRKTYAENRKLLLQLIHSELPMLKILPTNQGMHIIALLPSFIKDIQLVALAANSGIGLRAISPMYYNNHEALCGIMLGFGGFTKIQLQEAVATLKTIIDENYMVNI